MKLCNFEFGSIKTKKVSVILDYVEVAFGTVADIIRMTETLGDYFILEAVYDCDIFVIVLDDKII